MADVAPLAAYGAKADDMTLAPGDSMRGVDPSQPTSGAFPGKAREGDVVGLFSLPVDSEHKATTIRLWSCAAPHMRAFHLAWFGFFISFCSTFMAAPLAPVIREDLNLTKTQLGNANSAALVGTVFMRLVMGSLCDLVGPRKAFGLLMVVTSLPCYAMTCVTTYPEFLVCRLLIGCSLAAFVGSQYWASSMFSPRIVGAANAIVGGWGNLGGGVTQIVTVEMFGYFAAYGPVFRAWRQCFFCAGLLHFVSGMAILFLGVDTPDGNKEVVARRGDKSQVVARGDLVRNLRVALLNYRTWVFVLTYGFCFGVELVIDNIIADYFSAYFNLNLIQAGRVASYSGLMNVCSRALGGFSSDLFARVGGMRGRLWNLWFFQSLSGGLVIAFGFQQKLNPAITLLVLFSFFVQFSCGATYGIVPFISKRALGVTSGAVGAGGNAVAAVLQYIYFTNTSVPYPKALQHLGITIIAFSALIPLVHFPMWGSMFVGPRMAADGVPVTDEHAYYTKEFSAEERAEGKDSAAVLFAAETARTERSVRGGGMTPSASMTSLKSAGEAAERANAAPAEKA